MAIEVAKLPYGKRLPTIDEYIHFLMPYSFPQDNCKINNIGAMTTDEDDFVTVQHDNFFTLLPGPEFNPRLYRGQNSFYDPCLPSLYRNVSKLTVFVNILKNYEFYKFLLGSHPIIHDLLQWVIDDKRFYIDLEGIAQHYEFSTSMIDVTRSKDVALFFAYCQKSDRTNKYEPILDETKQAVLYTIDFASLVKNNRELFNPIGFQGLPRPEVQKACSVPLRANNDFNKIPCVSYEYLGVRASESKKYFEMFDGGEKLFPDDPSFDIAVEIQSSKVIDEDVLDNVFKYNYIPRYFESAKDAKKFLKSHGYVIKEKNVSFSDDAKQKTIENWVKKLPLLSQKFKYRLVSNPLM